MTKLDNFKFPKNNNFLNKFSKLGLFMNIMVILWILPYYSSKSPIYSTFPFDRGREFYFIGKY